MITKITIDKELHDQFMQTVIQIEGYKKGRRRISVEQAMKLYLNYAKPYKNKRLFEVAKENNMEVWQVGEILISRFMMVYNELGLNLDYINNDEHLQAVKQYLETYKPD